MKQEQGLVAILDALGAASYSWDGINQFLKSRDLVLKLLESKATDIVGDMDANRVSVFTFNDTVLVVYRTAKAPSDRDVKGFCSLLRKFIVDSLAEGILFRGALSIGAFHADRKTNTVMGPAITDAANWYNQADWVGVMATPQATLQIRSLVAQSNPGLDHLIIDYAVPLKAQRPQPLMAVNWPKAFYVKGIRPLAPSENPKAKCLAFLSGHGVPMGTEAKYFNTVAFFDHCTKLWRKQRQQQKELKKRVTG